MLVRRHVPLFESTVRARVLRPLLASQCTRLPQLRYASTSAAHPERIAVLGGGIAGLASAFFASREFPNSKITLYEGGGEIGGWLNSRRVKVPGGDVLFEAGPRTLRNASPTAYLVSWRHGLETGTMSDAHRSKSWASPTTSSSPTSPSPARRTASYTTPTASTACPPKRLAWATSSRYGGRASSTASWA
jgi:hypothetical protein